MPIVQHFLFISAHHLQRIAKHKKKGSISNRVPEGNKVAHIDTTREMAQEMKMPTKGEIRDQGADKPELVVQFDAAKARSGSCASLARMVRSMPSRGCLWVSGLRAKLPRQPLGFYWILRWGKGQRSCWVPYFLERCRSDTDIAAMGERAGDFLGENCTMITASEKTHEEDRDKVVMIDEWVTQQGDQQPVMSAWQRSAPGNAVLDSFGKITSRRVII